MKINLEGFNVLIIFLFLRGIGSNVFAQEFEDKVTWLEQHAIAIDPSDFPNSPAIAYFDKALAGKQVILLGEQNHGDGTTFEIYSKFVKLLHSRYGFEVVVFESGFYDCRKAWNSIINHEDPHEAFENSIFKVWSESEQAQPMFQYIAEHAMGPSPLMIAGFDSQFTGYFGKKLFLNDLDSIIKIWHPAYSTSDEYSIYKKTARSVTDYSYPPVYPTAVERLNFNQVSDRILNLLNDSQDEDALFWKQAVKNLIVQFKALCSIEKVNNGDMTGREFNNIRDEQMADNVFWLLEGPYREKKIILWANAAHTIKNSSKLLPKSGRDVFEGAITMGDRLFEKYGEQLYFVGTLSYQGQTGFADQQTNVTPAPMASINHLFHLSHSKAAFLDLNSQDALESWLSKELVARPDASTLFKADWTKIFDGIFFIHNMEPSRKVKSNRSIEK